MIDSTFEGNLMKMQPEFADPVKYILPVGDALIPLEELFGHTIQLTYSGEINCIACGERTSKSFFQGYCYRCFITRPETAECIIHPERCRAHEGIARDMEWSRRVCLGEHVVYLVAVDRVKVGVTRSQVPYPYTRWIDQGAWKAIRLAITPNRYTAGLIEVELKKHLTDRTHWRNMLRNKVDHAIDLESSRQSISKHLPEKYGEYLVDNEKIVEIRYPVKNYPEKIKSVNFDRNYMVSGVLDGVRGQYLIFDDGRVLNIRRHQGYRITLSIG